MTLLPRLRTPVLLVAAVLAAILTGCSSAPSPAASPAEASSTPRPDPATSHPAFERLEARYEARLGVFAVDTASGAEVEFRADERFAFASTYKALAAAAVLHGRTLDRLDDEVLVDAEDLVTYSPVMEAAAGGKVTLREVAAAAVQHSDNTAGNLLLDALGGVEGFDEALAALGDEVTVAAREETALNDHTPGDIRDTSTPRALAADLQTYAVGNALDEHKRRVFADLLKGNTTGDSLIRAGVPSGWVVGDKTGAAAYGTRNDIGVLWPPDDAAPIVLAILSDRDEPDAEYDDGLIAEATTLVVEHFRSRER